MSAVIEHFLSLDLDLLGCVDPDSDSLALDLDDREHDVVTDVDSLVVSPGEYQHCLASMRL